MRDQFIERLNIEASYRPEIILLTADLGFGVFDTFSHERSDQFLNVGVAEQNMALVAAGLALEDYKVFIYSIGNFNTLRCLEQIRNNIAYHELDVTVVAVGAGFSYGQLGMSHFAVEDISIMRSIPGLSIYSPHSDDDLDRCMNDIFKSTGAKYLRIDKSKIAPNYSMLEKCVSPGLIEFCDGRDVTVFGTGSIVEEALIAESVLKEKGINIGVYGVSFLNQCDLSYIFEKLNASKLIVTLEEHVLAGGLGSIILEKLNESCLSMPKVIRLGLDNGYADIVGEQKYLRRHHKLCSDALSKIIIQSLA